jgi:hypothetical protein
MNGFIINISKQKNRQRYPWRLFIASSSLLCISLASSNNESKNIFR